MKQRSVIVFVIAALIALSSCTLEKRHYRSGFYVHRTGETRTPAPAGTSFSEPVRDADIPAQVLVAGRDTIPTHVQQENEDAPLIVPSPVERTTAVAEPQTVAEPQRNAEKKRAAAPITKNKQQAVGAGIAAAVFFALGMTGLIIKGVGGAAGVFIVAAFVCCVLCIILASFLYPRDPVVKQPKEPTVVPTDPVKTLGLLFLIGIISFFLLTGVFLIGIFSSWNWWW
jgi:hypothetical protein